MAPISVCDERGRRGRAAVHGRVELDGGSEEVSETHKQKLYCYVDETGQDTKGAMFLAVVVICQFRA